MSWKSISHIWIPAALGVLFLFLAASPGQAQLTDTVWKESLMLRADELASDQAGQDDSQPEPLSGNLAGSGFGVGGSVSFGPLGPPSATASAQATYQGTGLNSFLASYAMVEIEFQFMVHQIAAPPGPVTDVPVRVQAAGSASVAVMGLFATALAQLQVGPMQGLLISESILADNSSPQASFTVDEQIMVAPDIPTRGHMLGTANIAVEVLQAGAANVFSIIDPVIEVADEPLGTGSYRDYFEVQFGAGYFMGSTPIEPTTWGQIKALYGH